jgi:hypothetical protein
VAARWAHLEALEGEENSHGSLACRGTHASIDDDNVMMFPTREVKHVGRVNSLLKRQL